jgi:membrane fusion protein (multidrug efflux system)
MLSRRIPSPSLLLLGALLGSLVWSGCGSDPADDPAPAAGEATEATAPAQSSVRRFVRVETTTITPETFEDKVNLTGTLRAASDVTHAAAAAGTLELRAALGQRVSRGEVVASINGDLAQAAVDQAAAGVQAAMAQLNLAIETYNRQEPLFADSILSALEWERVRAQAEQARAGVAQAQAALALAEQQQRLTQVEAQFDGVVEAHLAALGSHVMPGMPVIRVVKRDPLVVAVGVPERFASDIRVGSSIDVDLSAYGVAPRSARVSFVAGVIDPANRTFQIEAEIRNNGGVLKPEMIARITLTREQRDAAIVVPQTAVIQDDQVSVVYLARNTGDGLVAERREVVTGPSYQGRVLIESGISAGEELITAGMLNVTTGDRLSIQNR